MVIPKENCTGLKYRALKFTLPHAATKERKAAEKEEIDEPSTELVSIPLPESWAKVEYKTPDIDPDVLAKYLEGDAESSGDDGGEDSEGEEDEGGEGEFDDGVAIEH